MTPTEELKIILRENDCPFFTDEELTYYLGVNSDNVSDTAYQCLIIKSQDMGLALSGYTAADTSSYFRRLAKRYRPNNSGILKGV
jgi:hypothetical protein